MSEAEREYWEALLRARQAEIAAIKKLLSKAVN
jgi:hypothetical protein